MLWYKKQADPEAMPDDQTIIRPAELPVNFDEDIASSKLQTLLDEIDESPVDMDDLITSLDSKRMLMQTAFPLEAGLDWQLGNSEFGVVLSSIFPARRKLQDFFADLDASEIDQRLNGLVYGSGALTERMLNFCDLVPKEQKKERRAVWDLAAEIMHFRDPLGTPLMTRWVWDDSTMTGALREFIKGNDHMHQIPLDRRPEIFEGARSWFADFLSEAGFYREMPFLIDLLQAKAYADYVKAMSSGLGMVQAEFGGNQHPLEFIVKLLGIDSNNTISSKTVEMPRTLH